MKKLICIVVLFIIPYFIYSQLTYYTVKIPTRDGKFLAADLYISDTNHAKATILIQTPYNKNYYRTKLNLPAFVAPLPYDSAKYNYVILDWRGFYGSIAAAVPNYDRGLDGYDAVEWIASRHWCNGKVGTYGASALGTIQFMTAHHIPPHLICAMPMEKDFKTKYSDYYYGGDYRKEHVESIDSLGLVNKNLVLAHPDKDVYWNYIESQSDYPETFKIPMLLLSGWYDHFPSDVLRAFHDIQTRSDTAVRSKHKLIFGPWLHSDPDKAQQGELSYPQSVGLADTLALLFFDHYLLNINNGYESEPGMKYFVMGTNNWETTDKWENVGKLTDSLFLNSGRSVTKTQSVSAFYFDSLVYNPHDPSPTYGGSRFNPFDPTIKTGPLDQRNVVESRNDNLLYTTPVLSSPLYIRGSLQVKLFIKSNRKDTDFSIRLCDVYPDGRSMLIIQGIRRARFRDSYSSPSLMTSGQIYQVTVELTDLAIDILPGHKLSIIVTSSNYPMFDINMNDGGNMYVAGDTLIATNYIYCDSLHPSRIVWKTSQLSLSLNENKSKINEIRLYQNYPNPFSSQTIISFYMPEPGYASLKISDFTGKEIKTLTDSYFNSGQHDIMLDGSKFKPGIYFCTLKTQNSRLTKRFIFIK